MKNHILLIFCLFTILTGISAQKITDITTRKVKKIGYVTEASVAYDAGAHSFTRQVLARLNDYNSWALRGLDGKDDVSKDFVGILDALYYNPASREMDMRYTVNMPKPFYSTGNSMMMKTYLLRNESGVTVEFRMEDKNSAISKAVVRFTVAQNADGTAVLRAYGEVKLRWYLDIFISEKKYKEAIEIKIIRIAENLLAYGKKLAAEAAGGVDKSPKL